MFNPEKRIRKDLHENLPWLLHTGETWRLPERIESPCETDSLPEEIELPEYLETLSLPAQLEI